MKTEEVKKEIRKYKRSYFGIVKTRKGYDAIWIGGGAYSNTAVGRWVMPLKSPFFIRHSGQLSCSEEQALVSITEGDIIVLFSGHRDKIGNTELLENGLKGYRVLRLNEEDVEVEFIKDIGWEEIPESVIEGIDTYHNRSGRYFIRN